MRERTTVRRLRGRLSSGSRLAAENRAVPALESVVTPPRTEPATSMRAGARV